MRSRALGFSFAIVALAAVGAAVVLRLRPEPPVATGSAQDGPSIVGRVTDGQGRGVPDAHVTIAWPLGSRAADMLTVWEEFGGKVHPPFAETRTDGTGSFRLRVPKRGMYHVTAEKDGFAWGVASHLTVEREDVTGIEIALGPERLLVAEIQDPAGSPVPGAEVVARFGIPGSRVMSLTSDARGRFSLSWPRETWLRGP